MREDESEVARIRAAAFKLHARILVWAEDVGNPWAYQIVQDVERLIGSVKWLQADIERRRIDAEKRENGE